MTDQIYKAQAFEIAKMAEHINKLEAENAKLRSELESVGTAAYLYGRDQLKTENAKLERKLEILKENSIEIVDAVAGGYEIYDERQREVDQYKAENAKLRELARDLRFCARQSICLKCEHGRICDLRLDERCAELRIDGECDALCAGEKEVAEQ